ncbi:hypothetical protein ASZ78_007634 [Callipepla squamata]|uniref:Cadherin domain-containing protein n=1 Tax=Callipepla squamata TaxID=9009 RepID=A0A226MFH4_CALSU|nr:hypothetical protein ASZ78_007634 [Callipepla squamata]
MSVGGAARRSWVAALLVLQAAWALVGGQVRYSVPEEAEAGTVVGRLAQDLGLEAGEAEARRLRLVSRGRRASVEVSGASGALVVSSRLDREELCGKSAPCALRLEVLLDRPLRVFHVEVEVTDINDNAPRFPADSKNISISENSPMGTSFPLEAASDADIGSNAQLSYMLSPSEHFALDFQKVEEDGEPLFLVLRKSLDRESLSEHRLVLTASDGGRPALTGTVQLVISVLDANDNAPQFNQSVYKVQLPENTERGTFVLRVNATDLDVGTNCNISYSLKNFFPPDAKNIFEIDENSGEIRLSNSLDFENASVYRMQVDAQDKGNPPLSGHCKVVVEVLDVNDNAPEVWVTSLSVPVSEDAALGTVVALLSVSDRDSGPNGRVRCAPRGDGPFRVGLYSGEVSTVRALEEADGPRQRLLIVVRDHGEPPRSATATLSVSLVEGPEAALAVSGVALAGSAGVGSDGGPSSAAAAATNVWLVVAICAVSSLLVLAVVLYGAGRWAPRAAVLAGPGPATLVCASEVGSWSYSQRHSRSLCVATDGAGKSDLMVFSPNCPPPPGPAPKETPEHPPSLLDMSTVPVAMKSLQTVCISAATQLSLQSVMRKGEDLHSHGSWSEWNLELCPGSEVDECAGVVIVIVIVRCGESVAKSWKWSTVVPVYHGLR